MIQGQESSLLIIVVPQQNYSYAFTPNPLILEVIKQYAHGAITLLPFRDSTWGKKSNRGEQASCVCSPTTYQNIWPAIY